MTQLNFSTPNNADWRQAISVTDESGDVVDLTNASIRMDVRNRRGEVVLDLDEGSGLTVTDAAAGEFRIDVDASDMAAISEGLYFFDVLIEVAGVRLQAAVGTVHIKDGITQWTNP